MVTVDSALVRKLPCNGAQTHFLRQKSESQPQVRQGALYFKLMPTANFQISYEVFGDRELVFGSDCIYNERKIVRKVLYKHVA